MLNPEDNIEDIYRDFAKNYPLKADEAGWDEFEQKLNASDRGTETPGQQSTGRVNKLYRLLLAAVIMIVVLTASFLYITSGKKQISTNAIKAAAQNTLDSAGTNAVNTPAGVKPTGVPLVTGDSISGDGLKNNKAGADNTGTGKRGDKDIVATRGKLLTQKNEHVYAAGTQKKLQIIQPSKSNLATRKGNDSSNVVLNDNKKLSLSATNNISSSNDSNAAAIHTPATNTLANHLENNSAAGSVTMGVQPGTASQAAVKNDQAISEVKKTSIHIKTLPHKFFYMGIGTGPGISTVKLQQVKRVGMSTGIIAGVQLSSKINIETGLFYERKNYYSAGQYINKQSLGAADPDDVLESVDAKNDFFEIPVTVGVKFADKKNHSFYFSSGISSYFSGNGKYELHYHHRSGPVAGDHDEHDEDHDNNFFAAIPIRIGYALKLNTKNALRIEPYAKLPLYGIGKFSLPVISSGISINIVHSFFK